MKINTLKDLYIEELRDIYNAETQLVKALPRIYGCVESRELRDTIHDHEVETKEHIGRLDEIFGNLGVPPKGKKCTAMEGLIEEADALIKEDIAKPVLDAAIIAEIQRIEHYEIAVYGTLATFAKLLGRENEAELLHQTLDEEREADETLTDIASSTINVEAKREEESVPSSKKSKGNW
jgi:ferritin-like metal-binding protein YciE